MLFPRSFIFFLLLFAFFVHGGETTLEVEQDSADTNKAVQTAVQQVSLELMERFIEPSKLKKHETQIQKVISNRSNRYILYTRTAPVIEKEDKSFIVPVTVGFSEENLKKILLEEDLFYAGNSYLRILPLVLFEDLTERENYGWWKTKRSAPDFMKEQISHFYTQIQGTLLAYGFFLIHPELSGSRYFIPEELVFETPKKRNIFDLARFFRSNLVMTGSVKVRESDVESILNLKTELTVYNVESGRLLAEVERLAKIHREEESKKSARPVTVFLRENKKFAKGLGAQLKSIYEAGRLSSNLLKITVRGKLSYRDSNKFKKLLISKVKSITDLQENIVRAGSVTYLAGTTGRTKKVSKTIKSAQFPGFYVRVSRVRKNEIVLTVVPKA